MTRLGILRKFLVTNYPTKVAQKYGDFWAILKNITISENCCVFFLGNFWKDLDYFLFECLVNWLEEFAVIYITTCWRLELGRCNLHTISKRHLLGDGNLHLHFWKINVLEHFPPWLHDIWSSNVLCAFYWKVFHHHFWFFGFVVIELLSRIVSLCSKYE